ncbi:Hsp70 family protein [Micromonospora sp. NPDC006766]|uniref:Hsp70 family protein n=1 Tax=Micromonospora sp. NPDC006766 TaxID=3154778 RepID=UPI0034116534
MSGQQDGFALGVDLGTSNTVAVLRWPDGRTRPLLVDGQPILPSGVYADAEGRLHVGRDAQRLAQADPDRYEPNPKRRVDEPDVVLGDRRHSPAELLGGVLRAVGEAAVAAVGFLPPAVVTCPATWDAVRRQVLADALALAGWPQAAEHTMSGPIPPGTRLLREPVAAARYYTQVLRRPVPVGDCVAVFDFGGGTLDVAVVRNEGADPWGDSGFAVVACGGLADLGGLDLDAALLALLGARVSAVHPAQWARLAEPANATQWRDRLQFAENVRGAKEMLSRSTQAPVAVPGIETAVPLTRAELEHVATPLLHRAVAETRRVVAAAGLTPERLAGLFLVGGSSRIPLVARLLHAELGIAPTVLEQPELPVAEGALTDLPLRRNRPAAAPLPLVPAGAGPGGGGAAVRPGVGPAGTLPLDPEAPQSTPAGHAPAGPAGTLPLDPGTPPAVGPAIPRQAGPWPGVPGSGVRGVPGSGAPVPAAAPTRGRWPRRALWVSLAAVAALAGVTTAAVLYLTRERHPELDFHPLDKGVRVAGGEKRPSDMFTAIAGGRAYLAYPRDDHRLSVIAVDTATRRELWPSESAEPADRWRGIVALPGAVALLADGSGSEPGRLEVLDAASGKPRWRYPVRRDDELFAGAEVVVLADRTGKRLVGLDLRTGEQRWSRLDPTDEYGNSRTSVYPVTAEEDLAGPGSVDGAPSDPAPVRRLVQVSADRSVGVIDVATGEPLREQTNVARPTDLVAAHGDRLYVVDDKLLLAYDLETLTKPTVLYQFPDDRHRAKRLVPCGEHRACLLEVANSDAETATVVAAAEGKDAKRWPAPGMDQLVPVGARVLAGRTYPKPAVTLFGPDGRPVLAEEDGVAVRVNGGNLLLFADRLSSSADNRSVAGVGAATGKVVQLGGLKDVRGESCSWNTEVIACGSAKDFVLYRFVP